MLTCGEEPTVVLPEPSAALLDRNLAVLRQVDPGITTRIAAAPDEELEIEIAEDGLPTGTWHGRRLASARRPGDECARMLEGVDPEEVGVVVFAGFGLGRHVELMARRFGTAGLVLVVEPDLGLLKAVLSRIDFTSWFVDRNVLIVDSTDTAEIHRRLADREGLLTLGIRVVEHPPSRTRLDGVGVALAETMRELAGNARMGVITTLTRCVTSIENQLANLSHGAFGPGIEDLRGAAAGRPGIVVSAGPSLRRNIEHLAAPGVRDHCVIIATQTTLKPLLAAGVAPHYVTALDYHEISRRFHEGIDAGDVADTELVIDPKVNPAVPEAWPGRIRCIPSAQVDRILGPLGVGGDPFPNGATVAHLCHFLARFLGCDPVILVGQDLGFTDGLYYAPGNAIHDVWTPEFNDFNTIETMEWERIVRHRGHLSVREDIHGRRIFTDGQMLSYLRTFESIFVEENSRGLRTVDATEGGVRKAGTEIAALVDVLQAEIDPSGSHPDLPRAVDRDLDPSKVIERLRSVSREVDEVRKASGSAHRVLARMLKDQRNQARMDRHFTNLERIRSEVDKRSEARGLTDMVNQVGVYKRQRADRLIQLASSDLGPLERQRREIERDLVNVEWTSDAAELFLEMIDRTIEQLDTGRRPVAGRTLADIERSAGVAIGRSGRARVQAVIPIDPAFGGTGTPRTPAQISSVLEMTVDRLATSTEIDGIVLLVPRGMDGFDRFRQAESDLPVTVHRVDDEVFPGHQSWIREARVSSAASWRGGLHGFTVYDEVLAPTSTLEAMRELEIDAAVLVGPDWPHVAVGGGYGVDEVVRRYRDRPELPYVFVQAPPGIGSMLVTRELLEIFGRHPSRRAGFGHLLGYRSEHPESDPVTSRRCVIPPASVRDATGRYVVDSPHRFERIGPPVDDVEAVIGRCRESSTEVGTVPPVVRVELCSGRAVPSPRIPVDLAVERPEMTDSTFDRLLGGLETPGDVTLVFDGVGDPLLHPRFDALAVRAIEAGVRQVRVRTDLNVDPGIVDRLLASPITVVEIDLDADRPETWLRLHGGPDHEGGWSTVRENMERLLNGRRPVDAHEGMSADLRPMLPLVVPRIERRVETIDEIPDFFERWRRRIGSAVIDGPTRWPKKYGIEPDSLGRTEPPAHRDRIVAFERMMVLSDGSVPRFETDLGGEDCVGRVGDRPLDELWRDVVAARIRFERETGRPPAPWRA